MVFFGAGPAERSRRPTGRNKKNTLHTRGRQETNDTGHEQKVATTKKPRLTHCGPGPRCSLTSFPGRLFRLVFLFTAAPRGRSLTHCGPGRRCPPPVWCFFLLRPRPDRVVFFLLWPRPDAHSLTVGWGDFGKALVFFWLRPRRTRRASNIGSKKPPGPQQKKKHHFRRRPSKSQSFAKRNTDS